MLINDIKSVIELTYAAGYAAGPAPVPHGAPPPPAQPPPPPPAHIQPMDHSGRHEYHRVNVSLKSNAYSPNRKAILRPNTGFTDIPVAH